MTSGKQKTITSARSVALELLRRVEAEGAYASLVLHHAQRGAANLSPRDRALVTELVYGTLRWRRKLDFALAVFCHRSVEKVEPVVLRILRLTAYQLLFLDRIPAWAAIDQGVELATAIRGRRAAGFVNGVLRGLAAGKSRIPWPPPGSHQASDLGITHSYPDWLAARWLQRFGPDRTSALMTACNQPANTWIRTNTLKNAPDALCSLLTASGYQTQASNTVPGAIHLEKAGDLIRMAAHQTGHFHVQDAAAQAVCHLLDPQPGQRVLDACAAPGGKTATLAQMMADQGAVLASDIHPARTGLVDQLTQRLGISCVSTTSCDLTGPIPPEWGHFDRILLDAPCSSLGVLRRHPEAKWRLSPKDPARMGRLQRQLLTSVVSVLEPGGILVYSVCTPTRDEGPHMIKAWLQDNPGFEQLDPRNTGRAPWHKLLDDSGALSTWPDLHEMDAFYAVSLLKRN